MKLHHKQDPWRSLFLPTPHTRCRVMLINRRKVVTMIVADNIERERLGDKIVNFSSLATRYDILRSHEQSVSKVSKVYYAYLF